MRAGFVFLTGFAQRETNAFHEAYGANLQRKLTWRTNSILYMWNDCAYVLLRFEAGETNDRARDGSLQYANGAKLTAERRVGMHAPLLY